MATIKDYRVGQWVVAMVSPGVPCMCNPENSPQHPCRVLVEKVGRTRVYGRMCGSDRLVPMAIPSRPNDKGLIAYPIDEAKRLYRKALDNPPGSVSPSRLDELVRQL